MALSLCSAHAEFAPVARREMMSKRPFIHASWFTNPGLGARPRKNWREFMWFFQYFSTAVGWTGAPLWKTPAFWEVVNIVAEGAEPTLCEERFCKVLVKSLHIMYVLTALVMSSKPKCSSWPADVPRLAAFDWTMIAERLSKTKIFLRQSY